MANEKQNSGQGNVEQPQPQTQSQSQTQQPQPYYGGTPMYRQAFPAQQQGQGFPFQGTGGQTHFPATHQTQTQQGFQSHPGFQGGTMAPGGTPTSPQAGSIPLPAMQQSFIENILRLNLEKVATVYMTFEHEGGAESKAFRGEVEAAGRDHVIINDNKTGTRYLLPLIYLDYVTFQGPINYQYPFG